MPDGAFPYENPIELQFPLHFDDSAELIGFKPTEDDPRERAMLNVERDFEVMVEYVTHATFRAFLFLLIEAQKV